MYCYSKFSYLYTAKNVIFYKDNLPTGAQQGEKGGGSLPCIFSKIKNCPNFRKKDPDCAHPYMLNLLFKM